MIAVLAVLLIVAVAGVGAEAYVRHRVTSCLVSSVSTAMGGSVDIGLGNRPLLLALVDKQVPSLTVDADNAAFGTPDGPQLTDLRVRSRFNGVHLPGSDGRDGYLDSSAATVDWPVSSISATVRSQPVGALISQVSIDGGALQVQFLAGVGNITLRPVVRSGQIAIETVDARVLGLGIPANLVQQLVTLLSRNLSTFPLGLTPTTVQVTDSGVHVTLAGGHADLPPLTRSGACSGL